MLKIYVLGHEQENLDTIQNNEYLQKINLGEIQLPIPNDNRLAENRFYLLDNQSFKDDPEYIGTLSNNFNKKYDGLINLESMDVLLPHLRPNVIYAAAPTSKYFPNAWLKWTSAYHQTIDPYMKEMSEIMGVPLSNSDTFWANNFICHKSVFLEFLDVFKKVFYTMHQRHGYEIQMKVDDPNRVAAYLYERVSMLWFSAKKDLQIKMLPNFYDHVYFIASSCDNYRILTSLWKNSLIESNIKPENIEHLLYGLPMGMSKEIKFHSETYTYCCFKKVENMLQLFKKYHNNNGTNKYIFWSDCDLQFFPNRIKEWKKFVSFMENSDADIFYPHEYTTKEGVDILNAGVFVFKRKSIEKVIGFYEAIFAEMHRLKTEYGEDYRSLCKRIPFMDQSIVNDWKNLIKHEMIPMCWQMHGTLFFPKYKKSLLFHHAVDTKGLHDKLAQLEKVRGWVMD